MKIDRELGQKDLQIYRLTRTLKKIGMANLNKELEKPNIWVTNFLKSSEITPKPTYPQAHINYQANSFWL